MKPEQLVESREIQVNDFNALQNYLESSFAVTHSKTRLRDVAIHGEGTLQFGDRCLPFTDEVHDQLVLACGIPHSFEQGMSFQQFNSLFDTLKQDRCQPLTVCVSNETVVGIVESEHYMHGSAKKGVARTRDVLKQLEFGDGQWTFDKAIVSDLGVKIELHILGADVEPEVGDTIKTGLEISNSETGGSALKSSLFTLRLACTNGCTRQTDLTSVYYSKLGTRSYSTKISAFVRQLEKARAAAAGSAQRLYEGIIDQPVFDRDLLALHRTLKRRLAGRLDADEVLGIDRGERIEIANRVRDRENPMVVEATRYRAWDVHNAVTAAAREQKIRTRRELEEIGGNILLIAQTRRAEIDSGPFSLN